MRTLGRLTVGASAAGPPSGTGRSAVVSMPDNTMGRLDLAEPGQLQRLLLGGMTTDLRRNLLTEVRTPLRIDQRSPKRPSS